MQGAESVTHERCTVSFERGSRSRPGDPESDTVTCAADGCQATGAADSSLRTSKKPKKEGIPSQAWLAKRNKQIEKGWKLPSSIGGDPTIRDPTATLTDAAGNNERATSHSVILSAPAGDTAPRVERVVNCGSYWEVEWGVAGVDVNEEGYPVVFVHGFRDQGSSNITTAVVSYLWKQQDFRNCPALLAVMQQHGRTNNEDKIMWCVNHLTRQYERFADFFEVPANDPLKRFARKHSGSKVLIAGSLDNVQLKSFRREVNVVMSTLVLEQPPNGQVFLDAQPVFHCAGLMITSS
jgi:hypothetical protein